MIVNSHCSSIPDPLTHFTSLDAGSRAVFRFRRPTSLKEGPNLQYVCRRVYSFKWKAQNWFFVILKCGGCESKRRVVYAFTTPLRCFDKVFQRPYRYFSIALKVAFFLTDRHKLFTSNWLWIEIFENVVLSKIDITMRTKNKKLWNW